MCSKRWRDASRRADAPTQRSAPSWLSRRRSCNFRTVSMVVRMSMVVTVIAVMRMIASRCAIQCRESNIADFKRRQVREEFGLDRRRHVERRRDRKLRVRRNGYIDVEPVPDPARLGIHDPADTGHVPGGVMDVVEDFGFHP